MTIQARRSGSVLFWKPVGLFLLVVIVNSLVRWVSSASFKSVSPGPDQYPYLTELRVTEVVSCLIVVVLGWYCVYRPWRQGRGFTFDGMLFVGSIAVWYADPLFNIFSPTFLQNAHSFNRGTWANYIPGFNSPAAQSGQVEGFLWAGTLFMVFAAGAAVVGCSLLGLIRKRIPRGTTVTHYAVLFVIFAVGDLVVENFFVRMQIYVFWGAPRTGTLWAGELYQFPLYEMVLACIFALAFTWLRDSVDDKGQSAAERGVDRIRVFPAARKVVSFFAVQGFSLSVVLFAYYLPYGWLSMKADAFPALPSYLQTGAFCGTPDTPACPSQYLQKIMEDSRSPGQRETR